MEDFENNESDVEETEEDEYEGSALATAAVFGAGAIVGATTVAAYRKVKSFAKDRLDAYADARELKKLAKETAKEED